MNLLLIAVFALAAAPAVLADRYVIENRQQQGKYLDISSGRTGRSKKSSNSCTSGTRLTLRSLKKSDCNYATSRLELSPTTGAAHRQGTIRPLSSVSKMIPVRKVRKLSSRQKKLKGRRARRVRRVAVSHLPWKASSGSGIPKIRRERT